MQQSFYNYGCSFHIHVSIYFMSLDEGKALQNILVREAPASNLPQVKSAPRSFALYKFYLIYP